MDATHPIWTTPAVLGAAEAGRHGALIRMTRIARELTLAQAGLLCHLSPSALSRIETGKRAVTDVAQLRCISAALGIPPDLFGLSSQPPGAAAGRSGHQADKVSSGPASEGGDESMRRRELIAGLTGFSVLGLLPGTPAADGAPGMAGQLESLLLSAYHPDAHPIPLADVNACLTAAQTAFEACRYHELADGLPGLIATTHASRDAADGQDRERLSAAMAAAYTLASELAVKRNEDAIAWVAADRALVAARDSGDATAIAAGSRSVAIAMRRDGHHNGATSLLTSAALSLGADSGNPEPGVLAAYGSLLCSASYSAAQSGNRAQALELIAEAEQAAARLGGVAADHRTGTAAFSATNTAVYRIGVHTALGDSGAALRYARSVDLRRLPTAERHARFCIDTARAWEQHGDRDHAVQALAAAERQAPEEIRRPSVKTLISSLLYAPGPTPPGLRGLAARAGAAL